MQDGCHQNAQERLLWESKAWPACTDNSFLICVRWTFTLLNIDCILQQQQTCGTSQGQSKGVGRGERGAGGLLDDMGGWEGETLGARSEG